MGQIFKFIDKWESAFLGFIMGLFLSFICKNPIPAILGIIVSIILIIGRYGRIFYKKKINVGCGKTAKFRKELICGKTKVRFNPVSMESNYIWLCDDCKNKLKGEENGR